MKFDARVGIFLLAAATLAGAAGCASARPPLPEAKNVNLERYMGRWYVIASIPVFFEKKAFSATENYALRPGGVVDTTFVFHKGSFDGPVKTYTPTGFVSQDSNAQWGMRVFGPVKSEYRIAYLREDYSEVIVARSSRDHVWIMARTPKISDDHYQQLLQRVKDMGYDTGKVRQVPQRDGG